MPRYLVRWEIDYEGDGGPEEAARWAWETVRRPDSTANAFTVIDRASRKTTVDLQKIDDARLTSTITSVGDVLRRLRGEAGDAHR